MACYLGMRGTCAKLRWAFFLITIAAAIGLLAASMYRTVPAITQLARCIQDATNPDRIVAKVAEQAALNADARDIAAYAQQGPSACVSSFWARHQISFVLSVVGAVCLVAALATCCCFCCADAPERPPPEDCQYITTSPIPDAAPAWGSDQYLYAAPQAPAVQLPPYKGGGPGAPRAFY